MGRKVWTENGYTKSETIRITKKVPKTSATMQTTGADWVVENIKKIGLK